MMERRLLVGMAGIVCTVLAVLALQVVADARAPFGETAIYGGRG